MQNKKAILDCYNKTAERYAEKFKNELEWKHFDQIILKAFSEKNISKGPLIDLGCGPGQTTRFLLDNGFTNIIGTDLSPEMVKVASKYHPSIRFEVADLLKLNYSQKTFGSAIAFYAIVHFDYEQIKTTFKEIKKILIEGGEFLFSFHIGDYTVHMDSFLEEQVNIDFYALETEKITTLLEEVGFEVIDLIERAPYKDKEYPSKRAYIWAKKFH